MKEFVSLLVLTSLGASPGMASVRDAAFASSADQPAVQTSMFVGATYVDLNRRSTERNGRAALKFSGMARTAGSATVKFGQGFEIAGGKTGKPALYLAGREMGRFDRQSNLSGGAAIGIGVGVVLIAGAIFLATHCDNDCDNARSE